MVANKHRGHGPLLQWDYSLTLCPRRKNLLKQNGVHEAPRCYSHLRLRARHASPLQASID
jgi:hypothetical protein